MQLRANNLKRLSELTFDVLVIGGGINGAVAAAALSGKGIRVALIDKGDFAGFTSSNSSNLAWGGIKYMENYDFRLVRKLCMSRNLLLKSYPSSVREIRFLTTIQRGFRHHPLLLWLGSWLYWLIGNCATRVPRLMTRRRLARKENIINTQETAGCFEYSDAYLHDNDSRFVFNFIRSAMSHGCIAANYVESLGGNLNKGIWAIKAKDVMNNGEFEIRARALVNAAGPYVDAHNELTMQHTTHHHVFSKGIHIIVDQISPAPRVLAFFAEDGRLFFVIPMGRRTCIGATDTPVQSPEVAVTQDDCTYLLQNINKKLNLQQPLTESDVIATRCGVRPLAVNSVSLDGQDFLQLSRKHAIDINLADKHLSIFGGKLTDCINVGNEVCEHIRAMGFHIPHPGYQWYGEPSPDVKDEYLHQSRLMNLDSYTSLLAHESLTTRYWRRYGADALSLLDNIRRDPTQAEILIEGTEYTRCEIYLAADREMITRLEDFLRRRSKIAQVIRHEDIQNASGLMQACQILFGHEADDKHQEYFNEHLN